MKSLIIAAVVGIGTVCALPAGTAVGAPSSAHQFQNCTDMHNTYPHGVGRVHAHDHTTGAPPVTNFKRSNSLYAANSGSDRDHDHVACEAH